jgi:hypothetical protein
VRQLAANEKGRCNPISFTTLPQAAYCACTRSRTCWMVPPPRLSLLDHLNHPVIPWIDDQNPLYHANGRDFQ